LSVLLLVGGISSSPKAYAWDTHMTLHNLQDRVGDEGPAELSIVGIDKLLKEMGYENRRVSSNRDCVILLNRRVYSRFIKTVVTKPYLECLSPDNGDRLMVAFLKLFLDEVKKLSNKSKTRWLLDFVRLNIVAHRP
jgi:hypothetical protein